MTEDLYNECRRLAGDWAMEATPTPIRTCDMPGVRLEAGIYINCGSDMDPLYVGSALRPGNPVGVAHRIGEHSRGRQGTWYYTWLIALNPEAGLSTVHAIEGRVIVRLRPPQNTLRHRELYVPRRSVARSA